MWFWLSILALICWSGSDLFSKIGCRNGDDKVSHLKMIVAVGVIMGLHANIEILSGAKISWEIMLRYLPVSALYILSMAIGYISLRYIELSISSPICNSSGALVAVIVICTTGIGNSSPLQLLAVALVCIGVTALGVVDARENEELRIKRQKASNYRYSKSFLAIALPIIYCMLDALGTFADSIVLEDLNEDSANVAYELTFLAVGLVSFIYLIIKGTKFTFKKQNHKISVNVNRDNCVKFLFFKEVPKYTGAIFETAGQLAYIYAIADSDHVMFSAPIISSYCAASVLWSRLFLKEKLSYKHYIAIFVTVAGIVVLGLLDP